MTEYTGPYGFRFRNRKTGVLVNDPTLTRGMAADDWIEYPKGTPPDRWQPPIFATQDGAPLPVTPVYGFMKLDDKAVDADFIVTSTEAHMTPALAGELL